MQAMSRFPFLVEHKDLEGEAKELLERFPEIPVYTAEYETLVKMTGYALARGMLCVMRRRALSSIEEICQNARRIAILENVVNPTNIGAIFRSAAALHMDAILLTGRLQRSALPPCFPCEHGHGFSDSVDLF